MVETKNGSWFILVGNADTDELYALKRIRAEERWRNVRLQIKTTGEPGPQSYNIYLTL
eukprot:UN10417